MLKLDDAAIAELAGSSGLFYLGSSYRNHPGGLDEAFKMAARAVGYLWQRDVKVFSPIAHGHPVSEICGIDKTDHDFWMNIDRDFMERADGLIVLLSPCWVKSRGLAEEIAFFRESCLPIYGMEYVE
jgi:hypothetical protein